MRTYLFPLLLIATPAAAQEHASSTDSAAVLKTIDALFDALAERDTDAIGTVTIAEGRATGTSILPDGTASVKSGSWVEFRQRVATWRGTAVEQLVDPHVHIDGAMAMVWSPYTFTIDGKFSHCGIDHFDLVKQDGKWRILNLTWTQRKTGCPAR